MVTCLSIKADKMATKMDIYYGEPIIRLRCSLEAVNVNPQGAREEGVLRTFSHERHTIAPPVW